MCDESPLDNPIWYALNSYHRSLSRKQGLAARYFVEVSRFAALARPGSSAFRDLAALVLPGETVALFTAEPPDPPAEWDVLRSRPVDQMVCDRLEADCPRLDLRLGTDDVPEMLALTLATEPGPFSQSTIGMGRYFGFRSDDGRLVAMAGERLKLPGYTEISAVCTDPAFRGRGYAKALVAGLAAQAFAEGCVPFLHVKAENGARDLYEALGFRVRRAIQLTVLTDTSAA
jgi:ribosomal protein S18 acetylase RimI-like enzyme